MDGASEQELSDEMEVAQARMEGLIEDARDQHDIEFEGLNNVEVLTLATTFHNATEMFAAQGSPDQAQFIHGLDIQLREQAAPLFEELEDIHEPVVEQAMKNEADNSEDSSGILRRVAARWTSPFTISNPHPAIDRAWRIGMFLILIQAGIAFWNIASVLLGVTAGEGVLSGVGGVSTVLLAVFSVVALGCFTFAMGLAYERFQAESPVES